jgi:hypothetical protein
MPWWQGAPKCDNPTLQWQPTHPFLESVLADSNMARLLLVSFFPYVAKPFRPARFLSSPTKLKNFWRCETCDSQDMTHIKMVGDGQFLQQFSIRAPASGNALEQKLQLVVLL